MIVIPIRPVSDYTPGYVGVVKHSRYVELVLKKYYKFPEMKVLARCDEFDIDELDITSIPSKTFYSVQIFPVWVAGESKLNAELLNAAKKYSANEYWENQDGEAVDEYLKHIGVYYGAILSKDKVKYEVDFQWEINMK